MPKKYLLSIPAAAVLLVAAPAMAAAAPPYTVTVGTNTSGTHAVTGATSAPIDFEVDGPFGPVPMTCASSSANASVTAGVSSTGVGIATISSTTWTSCDGPFGLSLDVAHAGSWSIDVTDPTVAAGATETAVTGTISNVEAHVSDATGTCDFVVKGTVDGSVNEVAQQLVVNETGDGSLKIDSVAPGGDCLGLIAVGDDASFAGTYDLTSANGVLAIAP